MLKDSKACPTPPKSTKTADLTFSSTSEIKTFVRTRLGMPGHQTNASKFYSRSYEGRIRNLAGEEIQKQSPSKTASVLLFRSLFNPVDFDGSVLQEIKNSYRTNEIGFFITLSFFAALSWSFIVYRRNAILE